ncbi:MAG: ATP-binding cassette domain-containing protein [Firmicutes bacterium]|nr:ATP-binding cassette domain-containing protein [Bacillota bacterium]
MIKTEDVIIAKGLTKRFNSLTAVDHISFEIKRGERFGFLGPNGAGKTTTIKMLYGMSPLSEGSLEVLGLDVKTQIRKIKARIGVVPQETNLDTELSVLENLLVYANYFGIPRKIARERAMGLLDFMQLTERANSLVDVLSGGMKRRLLVARALLNDPELLILDEPTTGLDPQARHLIWDRLTGLRERNVTIIITTHYMDEASTLCDRLVIMDEGRIIAEGSPPELIEKYAGREALEIRFLPDQTDKALDILIPKSNNYEIQDKTLVFFAPSADELLRTAESAKLKIEYMLVRRATLEDVFLKLTGRGLRD